MNPIISVIIPVHNAEAHLRECLDSVLAQSHKEMEVLCVENGCTDSSPAILREYAARDPRVKILQSAPGVSEARNVGLEHFDGEWVTFVDADDAIPPFALKLLLEAALKGQATVVTSGFECVTEIPRLPKPGRVKVDLISGETAIVRCLHQTGLDTAVWGKLYEGHLFHDPLLRFRPGRFEDLDIIYRVYDRCRRVCLLRSTLYFYRKNPDGFMENPYAEGRFDMLKVCDRMLQYTQLYSTRVKRAAFARTLAAAYNALGLLLKNNIDNHKLEAECIARIHRHRSNVLLTKAARARDRIGALLGFLPVSFMKYVVTRYYR